MNRLLLNSSFVLSLLLPLAAAAKVGADKAAMLDSATHTCVGAERAGTASGVAAYTGKYLDSWPGMKDKSGYDPGPYADEKPLFTITADNMATYADRLTEGQKALLKKHPKTFRMAVYPSHRDFRMPDWVCKVVKQNATTAELVDKGLGTTGTDGGIPFPFPQSGLEAIWNMISPYRAYSEAAVNDIIDVYGNGKLAYGKQRYRSLNVTTNPNRRGSYTDKIAAHFFVESLLPARDRGSIAVGIQPNNFSKDSTMAWQYNPGIRRVRQAPEICCDFPVPPAGLRTIDDDYVFNGSPERYTWKLVGKKEIYVPYHNFKLQDPALKYKEDIIKPNTVNPELVRYELHRMWVVEGNLKDGVRHSYKKRTLYADEDTWIAMWADNYDGRDQLWRTAFVAYFYSQEAKAFHRGASIYHDLTANAYEIGYMVNERGPDAWWRLNIPMTPAMFSPEAAARGGR